MLAAVSTPVTILIVIATAYLLGSEGRSSDAFKLGGIVTTTHMFALYTVGLGIVWLVSESAWGAFLRRTTEHLTLLSGVGLIAYGAYLARPPRLGTIPFPSG